METVLSVTGSTHATFAAALIPATGPWIALRPYDSLLIVPVPIAPHDDVRGRQVFRRCIPKTERSRGWIGGLLNLGLAVALLLFQGQRVLAVESRMPTIAETNRDHAGTSTMGCTVTSNSFESDVWAMIGEPVCLQCHTDSGEAADSEFRLMRPKSLLDREAIWKNSRAFREMARRQTDGKSRLLAKAAGELDHGGGEAVVVDSTAWRILEQFARRAQATEAAEDAQPPESFHVDEAPDRLFDSVRMISDTRLLRRITLSLAARLPTDEERERVAKQGRAALEAILDSVMREPAFLDRLKEGFNDVLLTTGIEDNAETILSYDHFEKSRLWYQHHDLGDIPEKEQERTRWELARVYREALLREPFELIAHIVSHDRPFTEIVTADYIMVSPYTARGYGIFADLEDQFQDPEDPFEYIPAKLKALTGRNGKTQESPTGFYPHSGLLSTFHYLRRYPSTETNRNRLRARMIYQHWLGVDVMSLAPRSTDATAVDARYAIPTMQAPDCVVCHKSVDPLAGVFQDYNFEGHLGPRRDGWYQDMFEAGFESERMPSDERWRAPQWLGERLIADPRFAVAMAEHVYYILFGRKTMLPPLDFDDPYFAQRRCAYHAQRILLETAAQRFRESDFNLKEVFKTLVLSEFYRADGLDAVAHLPERLTEWDDVGVVRLLSPEQLERKVSAVFGRPWGRLHEALAILYGGIDSIAVTERNMEPSGAMGAVQRMMANDVACYHVVRDFRETPSERLLFPGIEPDVVPGTEEADRVIRDAIVYLHDRLLGREDQHDSLEVEQTFGLFVDILQQAKETERLSRRESYFCGGRDEYSTDDPHFTLRAWRAVVTYLLRQQTFLYE